MAFGSPLTVAGAAADRRVARLPRSHLIPTREPPRSSWQSDFLGSSERPRERSAGSWRAPAAARGRILRFFRDSAGSRRSDAEPPSALQLALDGGAILEAVIAGDPAHHGAAGPVLDDAA